ncbi:HigA family addiction module antitoxin [Methylocystis sp. WRRC1]|uniref:HigA family addiction module antitoxin n=1 Tax=Methylocystis sp. WRRC1 TaxID=1732014 RepID=UPI001D13B425|nr:HigA family addiction module antitoxin [Methylocystis sp. WRRC1]MCC3244013.1 HigA family addiction module antitoxin [Methylocystis sp. WRRC1]
MGAYREALTRLFLKGEFPHASAPAAKPARREAALRKDAPRRAPRKDGSKKASAPVEKGMTHPGEILSRYLSELGLTASDLARDIDVPVNRVTAIINGQRGVTADTALRLGHWFGVDPEDWLNLQLQYELASARRAMGAKIRKLACLADRTD